MKKLYLNILKSEYEDAYVRMSNALLYPETRAAVHEALTSELLATNETKLYGHLVKKGMVKMTAGQFYLAARREDYENAYKAYDDCLSASLALAAA